MKLFKSKDKRTKLEKEIDSVLELMEDLNPESNAYQVYLETVERLSKARSYDKPRTISPDTKAIITANLIVTGAILWYEKANVITSKVGSFLIKGRV